MNSLPAFIQNPRVFVATNACRFEIVANDENRHFTITRNHDRPRCGVSNIRAMAALLSNETKTGFCENAVKRLPVDWRELWHHYLDTKSQLATFETKPLRTLPLVPVPFIPRFFKHFVEGSHFGACGNEKPHCFIQRLPDCFNSRFRTCHVERHRMSDKLAAFFPDLNGVVDVHHRHISTTAPMNKAASLRHGRFLP